MGKVRLHMVALALVIIGALNWGLTAFNMNLVEKLSNYINGLLLTNYPIDKIIYIVVALAGIKLINRDAFLPFLGKTVIPPALVPLSENKHRSDVVTVRVKPNTKVMYWAAKKMDSNNYSYRKAYGDYSNSGVVMSDSNGVAKLKLQKGSGYMVRRGMKYIPPHVHYRYEHKPGKFSRIETVFY